MQAISKVKSHLSRHFRTTTVQFNTQSYHHCYSRLTKTQSQSGQQKMHSQDRYLACSAVIGGAAALMFGLNSQAEEKTNSDQVENVDGVEDVQVAESVLEELKPEMIKEVMTNRENKFIYFYHSKTPNSEELRRVEEHANKMLNGLRVRPYRLDVDTHFAEFSQFLKERNPKTADTIDEQIKGNTFLLANQYDDIWFWELDFINYFYGELLEQIFNFYQGPIKLISEEQLIMNQSLENDFHMVAYIDDYRNAEAMKKLKNFRKFHTKNTDKFFHFKFWIVEDKELAQRLKISTDPESIGDVYMLRQSSVFNQKKKNIQLCGYDFHSERLMTGDEVAKDIQSSYAQILQHAFNSPIIVHDYMAFAMLTQKFKTNLLVVYCDNTKDPKTYNEILRAMIKARKEMPINLKPDENGQLQKQQRHQDVVFVLSTNKNLMPITKLHDDRPQALFITPDDSMINLLNTYLPQLELIEGVTPEEFLRKAKNNDKEFAYGEKDDDRERNKKDTMKMIYSPERFLMQKMFHNNDLDALTNYQKIVAFVKASVNNELKPYWDTTPVPKPKFSQKVVGEDFDKRILESKRDALVLVYHPVKDKNRQIVEQYEQFVKSQGTSLNGVSEDNQIVYARYNGINESNTFKAPQKLPQVLYFKRVEGQAEKEVITYDKVNDLLLKKTDTEDVEQRLREFVNSQRRQ